MRGAQEEGWKRLKVEKTPGRRSTAVFIRSGDAVAKEVKQSRMAHPLPADPRLQAFERQCLIRTRPTE